MFPSATSVVYRNEVGEPTGWDTTYYDEPDYDPGREYNEAVTWDDMVCATHHGWTRNCPGSCRGDNVVYYDELCCGPDGCCSTCCGDPDEDQYRGDWHTCAADGTG